MGINDRIKRIASRVQPGGFAAFKNKSNRDKYISLVKKRGFAAGKFRSSGPTVESPRERKINAFSVIVEKKKQMSQRRKRRRSSPMSYERRILGF